MATRLAAIVTSCGVRPSTAGRLRPRPWATNHLRTRLLPWTTHRLRTRLLQMGRSGSDRSRQNIHGNGSTASILRSAVCAGCKSAATSLFLCATSAWGIGLEGGAAVGLQSCLSQQSAPSAGTPERLNPKPLKKQILKPLKAHDLR